MLQIPGFSIDENGRHPRIQDPGIAMTSYCCVNVCSLMSKETGHHPDTGLIIPMLVSGLLWVCSCASFFDIVILYTVFHTKEPFFFHSQFTQMMISLHEIFTSCS